MSQPNAASAAKEALAKIRELKQKLAEAESDRNDPIAIVSTACRFPKNASSPEAFWQSLLDETDVVTELPEDRWDLDAYFDEDPDIPGKMYARKGTFLEDIDEMDADFFGISPREATWIDPQQRLFLEVGWEALERAGWSSDPSEKNTGVFVGWMHNDYQNEASESLLDLNPYIATGSAGSFLCGRLSYYLGVQGPSLAIDTACSSSLVALHLACQSLRQGECDRAIAGGVNIMASPKTTIMTCKLHALSPSGHSRAFDASADGYLRGEGCGVVTLRKLSDAIRDGDPVLAVIRGSAITHNGFSSGLTAPNPDSQQKVIRKALDQAGVAPHEIDYLEAHGTGTELGDPIEMNAAATVLGEGRSKDDPLLVGSVKTNLGHLEAAAGIAGVIKTVLALQHRKIPAHLNFETPNPHIAWDQLPVEIVKNATDWESEDLRVAGVSAFGMSGTNAHLVLSEAPEDTRRASVSTDSDESEEVFMLPLGARTEQAVRDLAGKYDQWLGEHSEVALRDLCVHAATDRKHFESRAAVIASSREEMRESLAVLAGGGERENILLGQAKSQPLVAWQFTGQGSQYLEMGKELFESQPRFRETMERCSKELSQFRSGDLLEVIFKKEDELARTYWTQPALFAIHLALADLLESWGIRPDAVLGHSLGQYAAACVAGMLDWQDGIRLIHERSRLTDSLPAGGAMAAVFASAEDVEAELAQHPELSIAAHNGSHRVISGDEAAIDAAIEAFASNSVRTKKLDTSHAFHSALLDPILDEFEEVVNSISFQPAEIPLVCNVSGEVIAADQILDGAYWRRQLREAVQFEKSISSVSDFGCDLILELGPQPFLTGMAGACWSGARESLVPTLKKGESDVSALVGALGHLFTQGTPIDFTACFGGDNEPLPVSLPTYPFQRQRHWGPERPGTARAAAGTTHPLLGEERNLAGVQDEKRFENWVRSDRQHWLGDHRVFDDIIFPGAGFVELAVAATKGKGVLRDISFEIPLMVPEPVLIQTVYRGSREEGAIEVFSSAEGNGPWIRNSSARWEAASEETAPVVSLADAEASCVDEVDPKAFYEMFASLGIQYGTEFQTIRELREEEGGVLARLELAGDHRGYTIPPMLLDGALQSLAVGLLKDSDSSLFLPVGIGSFQVFQPAAETVWCHGKWRDTEGDSRSADLTLFDEQGNRVALLENLQVRAVTRTALRQMVGSSSERLLYHVAWQEGALPPASMRQSRWLVIGENEKRIEELVASLEEKDQQCLSVFLDQGEDGSENPSWAGSRTTVSPTSVDHWNSVFTHCFEEGGAPPNGVVWLTEKPEAGSEFDPDEYTKRHCAGVLAFFQSLRTQKVDTFDRGFQIITTDAIAVDEKETVDPDTSQFWGLGRVVGSEYPPMRCRLVDSQSRADSDEALISVLLTESRESQIAVHDGSPFVPRLRSSQAPGGEQLPIRPESTYLITGGLGMLGRRAGEWLGERGAEHIVLVSRRAPTESTQELIDQIEEGGSKVHVMLADISERASLEKLLSDIDENLPPLRGILHAAGVLDDGLFVEQTWERFEKVLAPKKIGARSLHELTVDRELDFFILYSSAASVLGSPGQANYATANSYLDGLAYQRRAAGLPALSINFGPWNEGMAATETVTKATELQGMTALTAEEAHEAIDRLVASEAIQSTMLDVDWGRMRMRFPVEAPPILDELWPDLSADVGGPAVLLEKLRDAESEGVAAEEVFLTHVQGELQQVLSLAKPPEPDVPLAELGLDSLMAVEFATRIQQQVGPRFAIPPTLAFDYPTVAKLTEHLMGLIDATPELEESAPVEVVSGEESIAVVGLGCRFPGADGPEEFWKILHEGIDATCEVPGDRWDQDTFYSPEPAPGKMYTNRGGYLANIGDFDAEFFGLSDQDAAWMDPQHRLLLEVSWQAMEDAGVVPDQLEDSSVGVFMGIMSTDYAQIREGVDPDLLEGSQGAGLSHSAGVGRLSYMFGFEGPSIAVDTASSSSLVAVCQAAKSLLDGDCNLALAGGVNAILSPTNSILLSKGGVLSPDGRSKSFSAAADGFGRGEGCGVVVLKRRSDAERDGDRILGLIRGSAVGHNGQSGGLTAPSGRSQQQMLRKALANAGVLPADIQYLEAHATGTELGDPIELRAAAEVLGKGREAGHELLVGSAKANISHLEAAGGISGLIKVLLSMQHGVIPRQIHFDEPSPHIPWQQIRATVVAEETPWPQPERPLAGVNALGMTGTNAHVVVEGLPITAASEKEGGETSHQLLVLSAKSERSLSRLSDRFADRIVEMPAGQFEGFCASAATGRKMFPHRLALVASEAGEAAQLLRRFSEGEKTDVFSGMVESSPGNLVWGYSEALTPGGLEGARSLYAEEKVFREAISLCQELSEAEISLEELFSDAENDSSLLSSHPVTVQFALQMGLSRLLESWGLEPDLVIGAGAGQFAAACAAGMMDWEDGFRLASERDKLGEDGAAASEEALQAFEDLSDSFDNRPPDRPIIDSATGKVVPVHKVFAGSYWRNQLEQDATISECELSLQSQGCEAFLEMGLANGWVEALLGSWEEESPRALSALEEGASGSRSIRAVIAELYALGYRPDFASMMETTSTQKVSVPTYPFERKHYWITDLKPAKT